MLRKFMGLLVLLVLVGVSYYAWNRYATIPHTQLGPLVMERPARETLRFFAIGDTGTGDGNQLAVAHVVGE